PNLRPHALLRQLAQPPRHSPCADHGASGGLLRRAGRALALLLSGSLDRPLLTKEWRGNCIDRLHKRLFHQYVHGRWLMSSTMARDFDATIPAGRRFYWSLWVVIGVLVLIAGLIALGNLFLATA